jgi:hypothetical protein
MDLSGVDFSRTNLRGAGFYSTIMNGANLSGSDLLEAKLKGTKLQKAVALGIVKKRAGQELGAAALRIAFDWFPAILPRSIEVYPAGCRRLHRRVISVVAIGPDLFRLLSHRSGAGCSWR